MLHSRQWHTGWRRLIGSFKLQIIFHKRAIEYRSLLWKMTYKVKGSYDSSPPCTWILQSHMWILYSFTCSHIYIALLYICSHVHHIPITFPYTCSHVHHFQIYTYTYIYCTAIYMFPCASFSNIHASCEPWSSLCNTCVHIHQCCALALARGCWDDSLSSWHIDVVLHSWCSDASLSSWYWHDSMSSWHAHASLCWWHSDASMGSWYLDTLVSSWHRNASVSLRYWIDSLSSWHSDALLSSWH